MSWGLDLLVKDIKWTEKTESGIFCQTWHVLLDQWSSLLLKPIFCCVYVPGPADLAAIPDFQSGAMENWGLTTYRETGLLFDPDKSSASDKLGITKVIAHELAHQVGDLSVMVLPLVYDD